jgi:hypothetical protein
MLDGATSRFGVHVLQYLFNTVGSPGDVHQLTGSLMTILPFRIVLLPHKTSDFAMPVPAKVVFKKSMQSDYPWCLPSCAMVLTSHVD